MRKLKKILSTIPEWIYHVFWKKVGHQADQKLMKQFRLFHTGPQEELEAMVYRYRCSQIGVILLFLLVGTISAVFISMKVTKLPSTITIWRNGYGGGQKEESLILESGETISFQVNEQEYSEEELEQAFLDGFKWIEDNVLAENTSFDEVRTNLNFMTEIPGGMSVEWLSDKPELINSEGQVFNQDWTDTTKEYVSVQAILSCQEQVQSRDYYFCLVEPLYSPQEKLIWNIKKTIIKEEERTREQESFVIPAELEGVMLQQPEANKSKGVFVLAAGLFLFFFFYRSNRMKDEGKERYKQLEEDYPVLINKLVLYLGAGINLRKTFQQIAVEYAEDVQQGRMKKRYMYEELIVMVNEMNAGTGEQNAYEAFAYRMENNAYTKLISLLVQNLQKGNDGLLKALSTEEANAFFLRIDNAKKQAEEAGTKLLFPMLLMLVIVMVIVMAPALYQFGGF